jgi:hypothetical protein
MQLKPLEPTILAISVGATVVLFGISAYFTRARLRRVAGVLIASVPLVPLVMFYDALARRIGWWNYPAVKTGNAPLTWYISAALFYGAAMGLVGWRVIRRYGKLGTVGFLVCLAIFGVARDYLYSITTDFIAFNGGWVAYLADLLAYASAAALVQIIMYFIAGPPKSDWLARTT